MTGEIKTVKTIIHSKDNPKNGEGAFLRLADSGILYAYTKYDLNGSSIVAIRSYDEGETWSEPTEIISRDTHNASVSSVSFLRMQNGDIGIFYMVKPRRTGYTTSCLQDQAMKVLPSQRRLQTAHLSFMTDIICFQTIV